MNLCLMNLCLMNLCLFVYFECAFWLFPVIQYADPDCSGTGPEIRTDIRRNPASFKSFRFFFRLAEIITLKPELFKKFTGLTEAIFSFPISVDCASPGTEHPCAPRIRWAGFADTGFKVMV
jgi:hypothetical protein